MTRVKRKSPVRHTVRAHSRKGKRVSLYQRGSGTMRHKVKKAVVGRRTTHTGGVIVENGTVLKPLMGYAAMNAPYPIPTHEYDAIKALEDLPHIPKGVTKTEIDGIPYLRRDDLRIFTDNDYKNLGMKLIISIEHTMWKVYDRGWDINDKIQLGQNKKRPYEIVIYDWSTADRTTMHSRPDMWITGLWKRAGYERYAKAREWANLERSNERFNQIKLGTRIPYQYTYMSTNRPASWMWMELPKDTLIQQVIKDKDWKPWSLIHTVDPLPQGKIDAYELQPTKYVEVR